ncbi:MAG: ABC transporter permease [Clostridia bacterium]
MNETKQARRLWMSDNPVLLYLKKHAGILVGLLVLCVTMSIASPVFLTQGNITNILRTVTTNCNLAIGLMMAITVCGIDLSIGSIVALSGVFTVGMIVNNGVPTPIAMAMGVAMGTVCGAVNGFIISRTPLPPFVVTMAMMNVTRGAAYVYTNGQPIRVVTEEFNNFGAGYLFDVIPYPVLYTVGFLIIFHFILNRSMLGRHIYAVGGNASAAQYNGVNIKRVKMFVYTACGFLAGFTGVVLASRMYSGQPTVGTEYNMDAISAAVLGGTSMLGGQSSLSGLVIGVLIIGVLSNGMNLLNINSFWQLIVKGVVVLAAVYFDYLKKRNEVGS